MFSARSESGADSSHGSTIIHARAKEEARKHDPGYERVQRPLSASSSLQLKLLRKPYI